MPDERIYLSPPVVGEEEAERVCAALKSGWVAPVGPELDLLERGVAAFSGVPHAVALSSATAGLHLALMAAGAGPGDRVYCPTITFGTPFPITYLGARPVFVDIEETSWNLDPTVLADALAADARAGQLPKAVMVVDIFGRPADYDAIEPVLAGYGVPMIVDAAESLGAIHIGQQGERPAGSFGMAAVFSFNGNKIMTTSGGGMLVSRDGDLVARARKRSTQSRDDVPWLEHAEVGYNLRMSNLLAAVGNAQLAKLPAFIEARRVTQDAYAQAFADVAGVTVVMDPPWGRGNAWLTTIRLDPALHPDGPARVRGGLEARNIESRFVWKPMHRQPVFSESEARVTGAADAIFAEGLSLPSGPSLTDEQRQLVVEAVCEALENPQSLRSGTSHGN